MSSRSYCATGIILKRSDVGEADRVVTIFTKEQGKMTTIAKGCRKLTSSKLSALEPGTLSKIYLIKTSGLPILTQAQLIDDFSGSRNDLKSFRKLFEVLEIVDSLLQEEDEQDTVFEHTRAILTHLSSREETNANIVRGHLTHIIETLGFANREEMDFAKPVRDFVEELTHRKLKAYAYLTQGI